MKTRIIVFAAALVGAAAAAAGVLTVFQPFSSAGAQSADPPSQANAEGILGEVAPGTVVQVHEDGSVSLLGGFLGGTTQEALAESKRMNDLADGGPNTIRCEGGSSALTCTPVSDTEVIPALKRGENNLYGRTVYGGITNDNIGAPLFETGELVCGGPRADGTLTCNPVDLVQPKIGAGETVFVTYKPSDVTFNEQGAAIGRVLGEPTVPLARESG